MPSKEALAVSIQQRPSGGQCGSGPGFEALRAVECGDVRGAEVEKSRRPRRGPGPSGHGSRCGAQGGAMLALLLPSSLFLFFVAGEPHSNLLQVPAQPLGAEKGEPLPS